MVLIGVSTYWGILSFFLRKQQQSKQYTYAHTNTTIDTETDTTAIIIVNIFDSSALVILQNHFCKFENVEKSQQLSYVNSSSQYKYLLHAPASSNQWSIVPIWQKIQHLPQLFQLPLWQLFQLPLWQLFQLPLWQLHITLICWMLIYSSYSAVICVVVVLFYPFTFYSNLLSLEVI